jgi:bifunctional NMN adenylyltransferase/nudix hydrolase
MNVKQDTLPEVGALVARFQVHELHPAHKELIEFVCDRHDKVLIVLGLAVPRGTVNNPLDLQARMRMVREDYPDVELAYIQDMESDQAWSERLDKIVLDHITPAQGAILYGGRDSFIRHYTTGKFPTQELESDVVFSGEELRKEVSRRSVPRSKEFRMGAIWQAFNRYPAPIPTVDVGVWKDDKLLLVRKADERLWRLPGGFCDVGAESHEQDARREVTEEAGIEISDPRYVCSVKVDDWRYRKERDKIRTTLFEANYQFGHLQPRDSEIAEAGWFTPNIQPVGGCASPFWKQIMPIHHELVRTLVEQRQRKIGD